MFKIFLTFAILFYSPTNLYSQNLLKENSWVVDGNKKNVYFDQGIFRLSRPAPKVPPQLTNIRSHFNKKTKQERIVLDFTGDEVPSLYGNISPAKKKLALDVLQAEKSESFPTTIKGKLLQSVDVYIIEPKLMTLEFNFDNSYSFEIFYLQNPTRVVIDVKR